MFVFAGFKGGFGGVYPGDEEGVAGEGGGGLFGGRSGAE